MIHLNITSILADTASNVKTQSPIPIRIIEDANKIDWNFWLTMIAVASLLAAIGIPFAQKFYEHRKASISFKLYLKKFLGNIYTNMDKVNIQYTKPSIKDKPEVISLAFGDYIKKFETDFKEHQNTSHPRIAHAIIHNLQIFLSYLNSIQKNISIIDIKKLYEHTLIYGNHLSEKKLDEIYSILLTIENFNSITQFHNVFTDLQSVGTVLSEDGSTAMMFIKQNIDENPKAVMDDLKHLSNHETDLNEILTLSKLTFQGLKQFFGHDKLKTIRNS